MEKEPYNLLDVIREEADLLDQRLKYYRELKKSNPDAVSLRDTFLLDTWDAMRASYLRILERYEQGTNISLSVVDGKVGLKRTLTTRHLERDYPSVAKAKRNLDTLVGLTGGKVE
jgi:hypothetical protein